MTKPRYLGISLVCFALFFMLLLAACSSGSPTPALPPSGEPLAPAPAPIPAPPAPDAASPSESSTHPSATAEPPSPPPAPLESEPADSSESQKPPESSVAATEVPTPERQPLPDTDLFLKSFEGVPGIVDPTNFGWPRIVEGLNGLVTIPSKPQRIITASVGHDEMALALVPRDRLVGVGGATKDSIYSNVASFVQDITEISRDPEIIVAQSPDVVVTSPFFPTEGVQSLSKIGIPVVQTQLEHKPEARINSILLMGYILGEEKRAVEFSTEVRERYNSLVAVTNKLEPRPRVLALTEYSDQLWVAGGNSTEGAVIVAAGGINAAEDAGVEGNQVTSLEGVIAMNPEIIIIAQPVEYGAEEFRHSLLSNEALADIPAIKAENVYVVEGKHFTTLSYWNVRGAEDLARILWPTQFPEPAAASFSLAE